ncbi:MAG: alpha-galactosidase [Anaerolineales bacterium]|jgi:alpha-galactosidase
MSFRISSNTMDFYLRLPEGRWDLHSLPTPGPHIEASGMSAKWRRESALHTWSGDMQQARVAGPKEVNTIHGPCLKTEVELALPQREVELRLTFALSLEMPLLLLGFRMTNLGASPLLLDRIDLIRAGSGRVRTGLRQIMKPRESLVDRAGAGFLRLHPTPGEQAFFTHGWQSWSYCGALGEGDRFPRTRLGRFSSPMLVNAGTPRPKDQGHFASDMFGVLGDRLSRKGILAGFLSQRQAFGSLEVRLNRFDPGLRLWANADGVRLDPGASFETDQACIQLVELDSEDPLAPYLEAAARENEARRQAAVPVGWCSWYQFFNKVTEEDVLANLDWAKEHCERVPLRSIQIDDGFQAEVGDWFETNSKFSTGLKEIRRRIGEAGFQPGLWLAPFIVKPNAQLAADHPEWLLRDSRGRKVMAGFIWNTFTYALDVTRPEVVEHVRKLVRKAVKEWGFEYLKFDFLYAGALPGERFDPSLTRAQALQGALQVIREAAGEKTVLLGCGCPIGSGIGIFDAMRIGADVAPNWRPSFKVIGPFIRQEPDLPAARNAIRNAITRAPMHRRWWVNDPDCLILRAGDTKLTTEEVQTLATVVALSGGSLLVSDHLPALGDERLRWLARLIPPLPHAARAIDWFDAQYPSRLVMPLKGPAGEWHLVALINWSDRKREAALDLSGFGLPAAGAFHSLDFWSHAYNKLEGSLSAILSIPAHGVRLLGVRPVERAPQWLGDTVHISQGLIVKKWNPGRAGLSGQLELRAHAAGEAWISLPRQPVVVSLAGNPLAWREVEEGIYAIDLHGATGGELRVRWQ